MTIGWFFTAKLRLIANRENFQRSKTIADDFSNPSRSRTLALPPSSSSLHGLF